MNDLAEKALQGAVAARRTAVTHPAATLGAAGFVVAAYLVVAGGAAADARPTRTLSRWFALQSDHGWSPGLTGALLLGGIGALVLLWLVTLRVVRTGRLRESRLWLVVAAWTAPFALGPPLMDTAVYGYTAFGFVQRAGDEPSTHAPATLSDGNAIVDAITPTARGTVSAAGPLGSLLQHAALPVGGGTALGAVIVLRVVGVVAAVAIGRLAADLAADPGSAGTARSSAIVLAALNPLVLLYVVSSPHLDGPAIALVLAALVAVRRRRWLPALVLAIVAGEIAPPLLVSVPVVIAAHVVRSRAARWRALSRDVGLAAVLLGAAAVLLPDGRGWPAAISAQFSEHTPYAISYATGRVLAPIVAGASYDDLVIGGRLTAAVAAVFAVGYLLWTARQRSVAATMGFALLAAALLAPNLYPWYLLWGLLCLAPTATGDRRIAVVALTAAGCVLVPPNFGLLTQVLVTAGGLLVVLVAVLVVVRRRVLPAAGDLSDRRTNVGQVDGGDDRGGQREDRGHLAR